MLEVAGRLILGGLLAGAAVAKLASPASSRAALASFGISQASVQAVAWPALIAVELALAAGVIAGLEAAMWLAAGLMAGFAVTMVGAIMRGHAGAPCACFGARSTVGWPAVARNLALALAFAALPFLPESEPTTDQWLGLGLGLALAGCVALGVAVAALAREVGMLRLRLGPDAALEIPAEGPPLGTRTALIERYDFGAPAELALAVFSSEACHVCRALEPAVASLAAEPTIAVATFEERRDADVWSALEVPGSPYAIVLDGDGAVLAKGTFNNLAQLEGLISTAGRRREERALAEALDA